MAENLKSLTPGYESRWIIRHRCGLLLLCLISRTIDIDTFERNWPRDDLDGSINAIYHQIYACYSDSDDHWRNDLPASIRKVVLLCVAFLVTADAQYNWPPFPSAKPSAFWMNKKRRLEQEALEERSWADWRLHGNDKVWPFHKWNEARAALVRLRLIRKMSCVQGVQGRIDCYGSN
jgi:hypothetical protein